MKKRLVDNYALSKPRHSYPMHAVGGYRHDGIKELACAVVRLAVEDATGRWWSEATKRFVPLKVTPRHRQSAVNFIGGRTPGPGRMNCFDFVCQLANIDPDVVRRGVQQ